MLRCNACKKVMREVRLNGPVLIANFTVTIDRGRVQAVSPVTATMTVEAGSELNNLGHFVAVCDMCGESGVFTDLFTPIVACPLTNKEADTTVDLFGAVVHVHSSALERFVPLQAPLVLPDRIP